MAEAPKPKPWNDPKLRAFAFQAILLVALAWLFWTIFDNTLINLAKRGIRTGFGFLSSEAGFGIQFSLIPYAESMSFGRVFLVGLLNTLLVSALGIVGATVLGFLVGISRLSTNWLVAKLATAYVEIFRKVLAMLEARGELTLRRKRAAIATMWDNVRTFAKTYPDEAAEIVDWIYRLDPEFRPPVRRTLAIAYKTLGFATTERLLHLRAALR